MVRREPIYTQILRNQANSSSVYGEGPNPRASAVVHNFASRTPEARERVVGPPTSGSELSALMVLQASGKTLQEAKSLEMTSDMAGSITFDQAVAHLRTGDLDAVFQTEVAPTKRVADVLSKKDLEIRLLPFSLDSIDLLVKNGMYVESSIQQIDYPQVRGGIYTVGVEALLVARRGVDVVTIARMLRDKSDDLELHLQQILAGDYEATADPMGESPVSQKALSGLIDPSVMNSLGRKYPRLCWTMLTSMLEIICGTGRSGKKPQRGSSDFRRYCSWSAFLDSFIRADVD
jgi:hypothetical protein